MPPRICKNNSTIPSFEDALKNNWNYALISQDTPVKNTDGNLVNKSGKRVPQFILPENIKTVQENITPEKSPQCKCSKKPYLKIILSKFKESFDSIQELKKSFERLGKPY